jgi:solute carrier family 25 folate transporter 32
VSQYTVFDGELLLLVGLCLLIPLDAHGQTTFCRISSHTVTIYDDLKRRAAYEYPHIHPAVIHMGSAVAAGGVADSFANPMFVVRTRLQTESLHDMANHAPSHKPATIRATVVSLLKEGGPKIFYRGMSANLLGLSHVAIQFPVYERLKATLKQQKQHESALDLIVASSVSKMIAGVVAYPHEVIRSRLMDARNSIGLWETCRLIYRNEGFLGFYAGLPVSLIRVLPNTCVTFLTYEYILRMTRKHMTEGR